MVDKDNIPLKYIKNCLHPHGYVAFVLYETGFGYFLTKSPEVNTENSLFFRKIEEIPEKLLKDFQNCLENMHKCLSEQQKGL